MKNLNIRLISIAGIDSPSDDDVFEYGEKLLTMNYYFRPDNFDSTRLSFEADVYNPDELNPDSRIYWLINYLNFYGAMTGVNLYGNALNDLLHTQPLCDSAIYKTLDSLPAVTRIGLKTHGTLDLTPDRAIELTGSLAPTCKSQKGGFDRSIVVPYTDITRSTVQNIAGAIASCDNNRAQLAVQINADVHGDLRAELQHSYREIRPSFKAEALVEFKPNMDIGHRLNQISETSIKVIHLAYKERELAQLRKFLDTVYEWSMTRR